MLPGGNNVTSNNIYAQGASDSFKNHHMTPIIIDQLEPAEPKGEKYIYIILT